MRSTEGYLRQFQDYGNRDSLEQFVRASGLDLGKYVSALNQLMPVFDALSFGEQPNYERIDKTPLEQHASEVQQILTWMTASGKADMRAAAIGLMGLLSWEVFFPPLERFLASDVQWERLAAIRALAKNQNKKAAALLRGALLDSDSQVRAESAAALNAEQKE
jgi:hypothetical protein